MKIRVPISLKRSPISSKVVLYGLIAASMGILLQAGPNIQFYLVSIASTTRASIYEAAFGDELVGRVKFSDFLFFPQLLYIYTPLAIGVLISGRAASTMRFAAGLWLTGTTVLTANDVIHSLLLGEHQDLMIASVLNCVGSAVVALLVVFLMIIGQKLVGLTVHSNRLRRVAIGLFVVFGSVFVLYILFLLQRIFFEPIEAQYQIVSSGETSGWISANFPNSTSGDGKFHGIFPNELPRGRLDYRGEGGMLSVEGKGSPSDTLELMFYADCGFKEVEDIPAGREKLVLPYRGRFSFASPIDISEFNVRALNGNLHDAEFKTPGLASFALNEVKGKKGLIRYEQFDKEIDATFSISGAQEYFVTVPTFRVGMKNSDDYHRQDVNLTIKSADKDRTIRFVGHDLPGKSSKLRCRPLPLTYDKPISTLTVRISYRPSHKNIFDNTDGIKGNIQGKGWLYIGDFHNDDLVGHQFGDYSFIGLSGKLGKAKFNNKESEFQSTSVWLTGKGSVRAEDSKLSFSGYAYPIWFDAQRHNQTIWESLSESWQLWLLAAIVGLIGWFSTRAALTIRKEATENRLILDM